MISLVVIGDDGNHRTEWFDKDEVTIGRVAQSDVVLPAPSVSKRHARMVRKSDKHILVDLQSTNGSYVNGRRLTSPLVVSETDQIFIGSYRIAIVDHDASATDLDETVKVDVVELRLLANIASHEPGAREVYADWLDERGDATRAEYVRLFDHLTVASGLVQVEHVARLRVLTEHLDPTWQMKLARPPIERCPRDGADCPGDWGRLTGSRELAVRSCARCHRAVHYCTDPLATNEHAGPIVVAIAYDRSAPAPRPRRATQPGIGPRSAPPAPTHDPLVWHHTQGCGEAPD